MNTLKLGLAYGAPPTEIKQIDLDCGQLGELSVSVAYSFTPAIPARLSGHPDSWEPEEPAEIEIYSVLFGGQDMSFLMADFSDQEWFELLGIKV